MRSPRLLHLAAALLLGAGAGRAAEPPAPEKIDVSKWTLPAFGEDFFQGRVAAGAEALEYWMQTSSYRGDPGPNPTKRTEFERLWSDDPAVVAKVNQELLASCQKALADMTTARKKARSTHLWIELALRARERLTPETLQAILDVVRAVDVSSRENDFASMNETPGGNGANVHGHLSPLILSPELVPDEKARWAARWGMRRELDHMNTTGDMVEFNLLESHWTGTADWEVIKRYCTQPELRRLAEMISERLWINRFLTWSPAVERNTGPGSRMAPQEWLGCDNERFLFATGLQKPIWLNFFIPFDGWNARADRLGWPLMQAGAMVPNLPSYLHDLAWKRPMPSELQTALVLGQNTVYPKLKDVPAGNPLRPMKYVNYQTENYTLGSSTASWGVNTCDVGAVAFWNNSRAAAEPLGSPARFCALYPHYVINGMSFLDPGEIYLSDHPTQPIVDSKGGPGGPFIREFIEFGRSGMLQDHNTLLMSYAARNGTHYGTFVPDKVQRASLGMFLFRWTDGTDGLYINRQPVQSLPAELHAGDWWFIEDGAVYAAVRPLAATALRGPCKMTLEKRKRHVVLYEDNMVGDNVAGISDEDWVKARSGFVVEMGNAQEYGSFAQFQDKILAGKVTSDEVDDFTRHVAYERAGKQLDLRWQCFAEEYGARKINGRDDPWPRFLQSPEFVVGDSGQLAVTGATLQSTPGKSCWLLACPPSQTWVAYQSNADQELALALETPAGKLTCARFPFGKVIVRQMPDKSVQVTLDASFRPFFGVMPKAAFYQAQGTLPSELLLDSPAEKVLATANGVSLHPQREERGGKQVWIINPYQFAAALLKTLTP